METNEPTLLRQIEKVLWQWLVISTLLSMATAQQGSEMPQKATYGHP